ncbi:MAG: hypothetical protein ACTSVU_01300 [Promethearchaeota archaeon]
MVNYASIEYWLEIPKIIEILIYWVIAYKFFKKGYKLSKTYSLALIVWSCYTASDLIMWITAANSPTWLIIDNIIRDIQIFAAYGFAFLIYLTTRMIISGLKGLNKKRTLVIFITFLILCIVFVILDRLDVYDANGNLLPQNQWATASVVVVQPNITLLTGSLMVIPFTLYIYSIILLSKVMRKNTEDQDLHRRMLMLILGICLIPLGVLYFAIVLGIPSIYNIATASFGRLIWIAGALLIWFSQKEEKKEIVKTGK